MTSKDRIDVTFDFTSDTPNYWDGFWNRNNGLGAGGNDPDACSKTLQKYHQILWSKKLPNGEYMRLSAGEGVNYLTWKEFRFGSDSITASFRYNKCRCLLEQVARIVPNYRLFMEEYLHQAYTIGGMMIFPKRRGGINQSRGCSSLIRDRWDLTLECIRRYYIREVSPLYDTLAADKEFFNLFVDFRGFVDFFYLQDCVTEDYSSVHFWIGDGNFEKTDPLPQTTEEYLHWIDENREFVKKRNERIGKEINMSTREGI